MRDFIKKYQVTLFFACTLMLIWLCLALNASGHFPALGEKSIYYQGNIVAVLRGRRALFNWIPNIVALTILFAGGGLGGARKLLSGFFKWRVSCKVWILAIALPASIAFGSVFLHKVLGGQLQTDAVKFLPGVLLIRFLSGLSSESIGGEAGWRGFALENLQKKYNPLLASIIIGIFWGMSHIPILTIRGFILREFVFFFVSIFCLSVFLTWFYNISNKSLLIVALVHNLFNAFDATMSRTFTAFVSRQEYLFTFMLVMICGVCFLILYTKARLGLDTALPARK